MVPNDPETLLARNCQALERSVQENPQSATAWSGWGRLLALLADRKVGAEADRLYAQADEKYSAALALDAYDMEVLSRLVVVLWDRAVRMPGHQGRPLLIRACGLCERMAGYPGGGPERSRTIHRIAFYNWGATLVVLGRMAGPDEADGFYAEAAEKFSAASAIDPGDRESALEWAKCLLQMASRRPGEAGRQLLLQARDTCAELVRGNPTDAYSLAGWGCSLMWLGARAPVLEAERLYLEAEEKFGLGLAGAPGNEFLLFHLAIAIRQRACMYDEERGNEILEKASRWVEAALRQHRTHFSLLAAWASILYVRAERTPGAEIGRLMDEAARLFEAAAPKVGRPTEILGGWGTLLSAQAWLADGAESVRLLEEARKKFAEAESRAPGSAAYELAGVSARLGEPDECRQWLEKSREPGIRISADRMARDQALAGVRACDWFGRLLAR
jgi:tetratricopeptide (TPR) repeat protein